MLAFSIKNSKVLPNETRKKKYLDFRIPKIWQNSQECQQNVHTYIFKLLFIK